MVTTSAAPELRVYRPGATLLSLFVWALMTGGAAGLALHTGFHRAPGSEARWVAFGIALLGIVFGPLAFLAHLLRACLVRVTLDPDRGLILSGGRTIPWGEIRSMELRKATFEGLLKPTPVAFFYTAGCLALVYFVVLPSCALFTPWHRRVILRLAEGELLVFHDLAHAEEFAREVSRRVASEPAGGPR